MIASSLKAMFALTFIAVVEGIANLHGLPFFSCLYNSWQEPSCALCLSPAPDQVVMTFKNERARTFFSVVLQPNLELCCWTAVSQKTCLPHLCLEGGRLLVRSCFPDPFTVHLYSQADSFPLVPGALGCCLSRGGKLSQGFFP